MDQVMSNMVSNYIITKTWLKKVELYFIKALWTLRASVIRSQLAKESLTRCVDYSKICQNMAYPSSWPFHSVSWSSDQETPAPLIICWILSLRFLWLLTPAPQGSDWCPWPTSGLCTPPHHASTLVPHTSSVALCCLEEKSQLSSARIPHKSPSLLSNILNSGRARVPSPNRFGTSCLCLFLYNAPPKI